MGLPNIPTGGKLHDLFSKATKSYYPKKLTGL